MTPPTLHLRQLLLAAITIAVGGACADTEGVEGESAAARPAAADAPPPAPAGVASPAADTVPLETLVLWDAAGAQAALQSDGLPHRVLPSKPSYGGLSNGIALQVGPAEVHLFFYGDMAAADRAYRQLDAPQLRPLQSKVGTGTRPETLINNNMLVIIYGGDTALQKRIWRSLTPGEEDVDPGAVEP